MSFYEPVAAPDHVTQEEANKSYFRSRFGCPNTLKRFTHELSKAFLESNHQDLREITLAYDNAQGNP